MTLLEAVFAVFLEAAVLAGLLATLVAAGRSAQECWRLLGRIETTVRVEQLVDDAAGRALAAPWARIDPRPKALAFSIDENGDGRIEARSSESVAFEVRDGRIIHRIGRQGVTIAAAANPAITYRAGAAPPAPLLAEIPIGESRLAVALVRPSHDSF